MMLGPPNDGSLCYDQLQIFTEGSFAIPNAGVAIQAPAPGYFSAILRAEATNPDDICTTSSVFYLSIEIDNRSQVGGNDIPIGDYEFDISFNPEAISIIGSEAGGDGLDTGPSLTMTPGNIHAVPADPSQGATSTLIRGTLFRIQCQNMDPFFGLHELEMMNISATGFNGIELQHNRSSRPLQVCRPGRRSSD